MLPDEPRTFYSSQGPCRTEGDFTAEDEALETGGEQDSTPGQPLYRCSLPWKPGWDAARILSFVRARDEAAAQAERMREDGEHEWAPPRVRAVAQRSGGTLPSEYVASASFAFDDVVHVSALRWKAASKSTAAPSGTTIADEDADGDGRADGASAASSAASPQSRSR